MSKISFIIKEAKIIYDIKFSYYAIKSTLLHFTQNPKEDPSLNNVIAICKGYQEVAMSILSDINFIALYKPDA